LQPLATNPQNTSFGELLHSGVYVISTLFSAIFGDKMAIFGDKMAIFLKN
jgi:uncharacterized membrane protein YciS (DUF1049 family)